MDGVQKKEAEISDKVCASREVVKPGGFLWENVVFVFQAPALAVSTFFTPSARMKPDDLCSPPGLTHLSAVCSPWAFRRVYNNSPGSPLLLSVHLAHVA